MKALPVRAKLQKSSLDPALIAFSLSAGLAVASRLPGPQLLRRTPRVWWGPRSR